jgi:hypothetical protein
MKCKLPLFLGRAAAWLAFTSALTAPNLHALDVIDPTGVTYTGIADNSSYDSSYTSANLFAEDVTGVALGTILTGNDYARNGVGDCYVAFQLDNDYTNVGSIFYAQRSGSNPALDKIGVISLWGSATAAFAAADPGTAPNSVVAVTNTTGGEWCEYVLTNLVAGQYFLVKLEQTSVGGNPGGKQLRLGAQLGLPPTLIQSPANTSVYVGGTATLASSSSGTAPLKYVWSFNGGVVTNNARISGAQSGSLTIADVGPGDAGTYTLTLSNAWGTASAMADLTAVKAPTNAAVAAVIGLNPLAFWQLNDPVGSTIAQDLVGTHNGTFGSDSGLGVAGPESPAFPGFSANNTAVQIDAFDINSAVTVPAMNISPTNSVTILAWIYADDSSGPQQPYTGIAFCRGGGTIAGLICSSDGTALGYQWGGIRYDFASGLTLPANEWTLVAMVYTTNFTTLYCGTSNGIVLSAEDDYSQPGQSFGVPMMIGLDTDVGESSRTFNGDIDDVAFFDRALSAAEINAIYAAGTGIVPTLQILSQSATNLSVFQGQSFTLSVQASGLSPAFQWYQQGTLLAGATNSSLTVTHATLSDTAGFFVVVSNQVNTVTSAVFSVTVPAYLPLPIGASGVIYTEVSASSTYPGGGYDATNLFDTDLTGVPLGTHLSGQDWADNGAANSYPPAYLAFQVDQVYTVSALLYAQRNSQPGEAVDKVTSINLWASPTTPFTAADPGTPPASTVLIPDEDAAVLHAYLLTNEVSGQYFLLGMVQNPVVEYSNIGGNEFRLATLVTPVPLACSNSPAGLTLSWPAGATLQQAPAITGPWVTASGVTNGVPVPTTAAQQFYRLLY